MKNLSTYGLLRSILLLGSIIVVSGVPTLINAAAHSSVPVPPRQEIPLPVPPAEEITLKAGAAPTPPNPAYDAYNRTNVIVSSIVEKTIKEVDRWIASLKAIPSESEHEQQLKKINASIHKHVKDANNEVSPAQEKEIIENINAYIKAAWTIKKFRERQINIINDINNSALSYKEKLKKKALEFTALKSSPEALFLKNSLPAKLLAFVNPVLPKIVAADKKNNRLEIPLAAAIKKTPSDLQKIIFAFDNKEWLSYLFDWSEIYKAPEGETILALNPDGSVFVTSRWDYKITIYKRDFNPGSYIQCYTTPELRNENLEQLSDDGLTCITINTEKTLIYIYKYNDQNGKYLLSGMIPYITPPLTQSDIYHTISKDCSTCIITNLRTRTIRIYTLQLNGHYESSYLTPDNTEEWRPFVSDDGFVCITSAIGIDSSNTPSKSVRIYQRTLNKASGLYFYERKNEVFTKLFPYLVSDDGSTFIVKNSDLLEIYRRQHNTTYKKSFEFSLSKNDLMSFDLSSDGSLFFVSSYNHNATQCRVYQWKKNTYAPVYTKLNEVIKSITPNGSHFFTISDSDYFGRIYQYDEENNTYKERFKPRFKTPFTVETSALKDPKKINADGSLFICWNNDRRPGIYQRQVDGSYIEAPIIALKENWSRIFLNNNGSLVAFTSKRPVIYSTIPKVVFNEKQLELLYTFYQHLITSSDKTISLNDYQAFIWESIPTDIRKLLSKVTINFQFNKSLQALINEYKSDILNFLDFTPTRYQLQPSDAHYLIEKELTQFFNEASALLSNTVLMPSEIKKRFKKLLASIQKKINIKTFFVINTESAIAWKNFLHSTESAVNTESEVKEKSSDTKKIIDATESNKSSPLKNAITLAIESNKKNTLNFYNYTPTRYRIKSNLTSFFNNLSELLQTPLSENELNNRLRILLKESQSKINIETFHTISPECATAWKNFYREVESVLYKKETDEYLKAVLETGKLN